MQNKKALELIERAEGQNLTELDLSYNFLTILPSEIGKLTNLTTLDLSHNRLTTLPSEIGKLTNLTTLNISGNNLKTLPFDIGKLSNLTSLNLSNNKLTTLPVDICKLSNLTALDLSFNYLTALPPEIGKLTNLTLLYLSKNQTIVAPDICKLSNLTLLDLSKNNLKELPPDIGKLTNLTTLDLSLNNLTEIPPDIGKLSNLTLLNLYYNNLKELPPDISKLTKLNAIDLDNNPLESPPPEIVRRGKEAILEFLRHLSDRAIVNNEAKLLLVGQGDVGKTCLARRLMLDKFIQDKTTKGIEISKWIISAPTTEKEKINLNVWDFGGQEIYHVTHQFFLTRRSVYLLVWNARKARDYEHIFYWLHTIEAFGENSPVILVMSKLNERDDDLNMKDIKEKFPQIVGLCKIDSEDGTGISALTDIIRKTAWSLPHMKTLWIESWLKARSILENDGCNWINYNKFKKICTKEGLDEKQIEILDEYLHDLGVIIHFKDRLGLQDMVILKPDWATKAFYQILDTNFVRKRDGILLHSELKYIWKPHVYPLEIYPKLLELMNKFELAYALPDKESHLVAELLPSTQPDFDWNNRDNLCFYYSYDFLPAGVMTRFIVLVHEDLERKNGMDICWREGAVMQRKDTRALVKVKPSEKQIEIRIHGNRETGKRELLAIICNQFDHIHRSIKKIKISQEIPCRCSSDCSYRWNYEQLLIAEDVGKEAVPCHLSWKEVPLSLLLDGYRRERVHMNKSEESQKNVVIQTGSQSRANFYSDDKSINIIGDLHKDLENLKELVDKDYKEKDKTELIQTIDEMKQNCSDPSMKERVKKKLGWILTKTAEVSSISSLVITILQNHFV